MAQITSCSEKKKVTDSVQKLSEPAVRSSVILSGCETERRGLEIGPYFQPVTDRSVHDVLYVDCCDDSELQRKFRENPTAVG